MKKLILSLSIFTVLLSACGGDQNNNESKNNAEVTNNDDDGCLDFAITEKYGSLDPIKITDVASFHIASQIFEPLLKFNEKDLSVEPLIAESWEVSEDNLILTIKLKLKSF